MPLSVPLMYWCNTIEIFPFNGITSNWLILISQDLFLSVSLFILLFFAYLQYIKYFPEIAKFLIFSWCKCLSVRGSARLHVALWEVTFCNQIFIPIVPLITFNARIWTPSSFILVFSLFILLPANSRGKLHFYMHSLAILYPYGLERFKTGFSNNFVGKLTGHHTSNVAKSDTCQASVQC